MRSRCRGLTLVEALIATGLALLLGLLMVKLLSSGLGAQSKGAQSRDAQSGVRNLLGILVAELRSAVAPPLAEPLVVTPVFWPGAWGADQELAQPSFFYPRERLPNADGGETDSAVNRLFYVRSTETPADPTLGPLASFALVELFIPSERPGTVERRIHLLTGLDAFLKKGQVQGADETQREAWLLDIQAVEALEPSLEPDVLFDAGPQARVAFRVSHRTFEPVSDPGRTRFPQIFDPAVFRLTVVIAIGEKEPMDIPLAWPQKEAWATFREESTELKIPSVRQN